MQVRKAEVNILGTFQSVLADPKVLEQVLINLLENAIKFVAGNTTPRVEVRGETRGEMVRLSIKDNGIGIDMQYRDRIFGAFERLHSAEAYEGTGIGLAIVKHGVERMGGRVGVESRPGAGSTFWVELPGVKHENMLEDLEKTEQTQTTVTRLLCEHNRRQPV